MLQLLATVKHDTMHVQFLKVYILQIELCEAAEHSPGGTEESIYFSYPRRYDQKDLSHQELWDTNLSTNYYIHCVIYKWTNFAQETVDQVELN